MVARKELTVEEKARLLIREVESALAAGTQHYHPTTGKLLTTTAEIIQCFRDHKTVHFLPRQSELPSECIDAD